MAQTHPGKFLRLQEAAQGFVDDDQGRVFGEPEQVQTARTFRVHMEGQ